MAKYFVFIDETCTWSKEPYFGLWCLIIPEEKIGEYNALLMKKYHQIFSIIKNHEQYLLQTLPKENIENFLKWRTSPYEMKFKNINQTTCEGYKRLFSQYFKFDQAKFCALVIDKTKNPINSSYFDFYLHKLTELLKKNFSDQDEFVILPDSITVSDGRNYEKELKNLLVAAGKNCFWVCRLESHSNIFLQMVDCLIWAAITEFKWTTNIYKNAIVQKIKQKLGIKSFKEDIVTTIPNFFSIWNYS